MSYEPWVSACCKYVLHRGVILQLHQFHRITCEWTNFVWTTRPISRWISQGSLVAYNMRRPQWVKSQLIRRCEPFSMNKICRKWDSGISILRIQPPMAKSPLIDANKMQCSPRTSQLRAKWTKSGSDWSHRNSYCVLLVIRGPAVLEASDPTPYGLDLPILYFLRDFVGPGFHFRSWIRIPRRKSASPFGSCFRFFKVWLIHNRQPPIIGRHYDDTDVLLECLVQHFPHQTTRRAVK